MGRGDLAAGASPVGGGGVPVSAGAATTGDLPLQACPDSGRRPISRCCGVSASNTTSALPRCWRRASPTSARHSLSCWRITIPRPACAAQAVPYWQRAGQRAIERSANVEAISHLTTALALLTAFPDGPERTQQELALLTALGVPLVLTKGHAAPEVETTYARARELCRQLGDTPQLFSRIAGPAAVLFPSGGVTRRRTTWGSSSSAWRSASTMQGSACGPT